MLRGKIKTIGAASDSVISIVTNVLPTCDLYGPPLSPWTLFNSSLLDDKQTASNVYCCTVHNVIRTPCLFSYYDCPSITEQFIFLHH